MGAALVEYQPAPGLYLLALFIMVSYVLLRLYLALASIQARPSRMIRREFRADQVRHWSGDGRAAN